MKEIIYPSNSIVEPRFFAHLHSEFNATSAPFTQSTTGTGAGVNFFNAGTFYEGRLGLAIMSTGTTTSGAARFHTNQYDQLIFGTKPARFEAMIQIPTLSDATNRFIVRCGFSDNFSSVGTDAALIDYVDNVNGGRWNLWTASNGSTSSADSGVTVAAGTWYRLEAEVNRAGTLVTYFINGSRVGSISTNIPTGTSRGTGFMIYILKSAGTTSRTLYCDSALVAQEVDR
jgi:hypothetical protein